jgi:hypothetical protein
MDTRWRTRLERFNAHWMPWISLAGGVATSLLWRQGIDHVRASVVLASLVGLAILLGLFPPWRRRGNARTRLDTLAWWAAVSLAQNVLWFVTPFYLLATSWTSRNALFSLALVGLLVLFSFDVLLQHRVLRNGRIAAVFVALAGLAAYQLLLPVLSGVAPRHAIYASGALAVASALPLGWRRARGRPRAAAFVLAAALGGALAARLALPWIPPAPMRLVAARFALERDGLEPLAALPSLPVGSAPGYVFVAVEAPRGLHETVRLVVAGQEEATSRPLEVEGGRAGGYRLWQPVPRDSAGRVRIAVVTEGGQIVGSASVEIRAGEPVPGPAQGS